MKTRYRVKTVLDVGGSEGDVCWNGGWRVIDVRLIFMEGIVDTLSITP